MGEPKPTIEEQAANFWVTYFCNCGETEMALEFFREILAVFAWRAETGSMHIDFGKRRH